MSAAPGRPAARGWYLLTALTLLGGAAALGSSSRVAAGPTEPDTLDMEGFQGENGLWVREIAGQLQVAWLTAPDRAGLLEAWRGDERIHRATTPPGRRHLVRFPVSSYPVVLRYGGLEDETDRHQTTLYPAPRSPASSVLGAADSLYVVGDIHGERRTLLRVLQNAGLVNRAGEWAGGRRHVVFVGDVFDRGHEVTGALWLLYRLQHEAAAAGGSADLVLGNHEVMIFAGDLRYVSEKERMVAALHRTDYQSLFDLRETVLGRWLATRPGLMQVGDVLLAHGGVTPEYSRYAVQAFNDSLSAFMAEDLLPRWSDTTLVVMADSVRAAEAKAARPDLSIIVMDSVALARRSDFLFGENGVFWFRGYVQSDTLDSALAAVLDRYGARVHVVAHTPVGTIEVRYGGRLAAVNMVEPATELLLLARTQGGSGYVGYRYRDDGPPEEVGPLGSGGTMGGREVADPAAGVGASGRP